MRCRDVMSSPVIACHARATVVEAAELMRDHDIGFVCVWDEVGRAVGAITDRDIALRVLASTRAPDHVPVLDAMTTPVIACELDDDIGVAADQMRALQKSRIVVRDRSRRARGVISLSALARIGTAPDRAGEVAAFVAMREAPATHDPLAPGRGDEIACREVMKRDVVVCRPDANVREVAALMRDHDIGFVPVCDERGTIIGTLTDRDLTVRVVAGCRPVATTRARDVLTPELVYCEPEDPLTVAEDLMIDRKKARIVCSDADLHPRGIISLSDIARLEPPDVVARVVAGVCSRRAA